MNYVYGIVCHRLTNPLIFLVNELLKSPKSILLIHVDLKSNLDFIKDSLPQHSHLYFIDEREDVRWGAFSQIQATINLLQFAKKFDYQYFSLLSGDDIPLSLNSEREIFLDNAYSQNIEFIGGSSEHIVAERVNIKYLSYFYCKKSSKFSRRIKRVLKLYCKIFRRQNILNLPTLYYGSSWFTITQEAVSTVLNYLENNINYIRVFNKSFCGDELFFQTIIFNSRLNKNIYAKDQKIHSCIQAMRYIDWETGPDYPRTLNIRDFDKISTSNLLFARKVDPNISLDRLHDFLYKKEP